MSNKLKIFISFSVSLLLVAYVIYQIDWEVVFTELGQAKIWPILLTAVFWFLHFFVRAVRWKYLLPAHQTPSLMVRFESIMIGVFATFILPLRAGEIIRPIYLSKYSQINFASGFVSVFIERFFDLVCVLLMFALISMYVPAFPSWAVSGATMLGILSALIFLFILLCSLLPNFIVVVTDKVTSFLPLKIANLIRKIVSDVIDGATAIKTTFRFFMIIFLTATIWGLNVLIFHFFLEVVSVQPDFILSITLTVLVALAVAAPSAPGFIGIYQVAAIGTFALFGIGAEKATAYSLLSHFQQYLLYSFIAIPILIKRGLKLKNLRSA